MSRVGTVRSASKGKTAKAKVSAKANARAKPSVPAGAQGEESYAGIGDAAVRAKTGKGWRDWFAILDRAKASRKSHPEIAAFLHEQQGIPGWWCQMVTVGYEQARGLRQKNQKANGFAASASKTIGIPVEELFDAWSEERARRRWLGDADLTVRKATRPKSMRITWSDGSSVQVNFWSKGPSKSQVAIEHEKLGGSADVARMKQTWATALESLKTSLEGKKRGT